MDFRLSDEQVALRDSVERFCAREYPAERRGDAEPPALRDARWRALAGIGLAGLPFDESVGGSGLGAVEMMIVAEALGAVLGGNGWTSSVALAGMTIASLGTDGQRARWLAPLTRGDARLAFACAESGTRGVLADVRTRAIAVDSAAGAGYRLEGDKQLVLDGDAVDAYVLVARSAGGRCDVDGLSLFVVDANASGLEIRAFDTLDGRRAAHLRLRGVHVDAGRLLGPEGGAHEAVVEAVDRATAIHCAEAVGAIDELTRLTAEHLRTRRQFGRPLADFQALQHRFADLVIGLEQARSLACAAAIALDDAALDVHQRRRYVSAAKALIGALGRRAGLEAIQMHGAMGMTDECRVGRYAKRLMVIDRLFGGAPEHLRRFDSLAPRAMVREADPA